MARIGWHFLACSFLASLFFTVCSVSAKPEKDASVKDIMGRLHKGDDAVWTSIKADLKQDKVDWDAVQKLTKQYLDGAESLPKNDPPKGEKDSWTKYTKQFIAGAKEMDDAAQKKDKDKTVTASMNLGKGCADCHSAHKPKK